jgi:hypothetical protein
MYIHPSISIHVCVCVCARARGSAAARVSESVLVHGDGQHARMQAVPCAVGWGHVR